MINNDMRLQEVITEALEWGNGPDKDIFMSLKGLVNNNNGVWKSTKQRWFMMNRKIGEGDLERAPELNKRFFGIETKEGQTLVTPEAMAQWAKYGSRSMIPVRYGFVVDEYGVVTSWRIGNKGNMSSGASPDPSKTKLEWTRPDDADVQHLIPSPEELAAKEKAKKKEFLGALGQGAGKHLGTEGERMKFEELTLVAKKSVGDSYFGYNQSVEKFWNMYEDNYGNVVYHTGKEGPEKGQKISGAATVKKHIISKKGDNVTIVIRPRFKLIDAEGVTESFYKGGLVNPDGYDFGDQSEEEILRQLDVINVFKAEGWHPTTKRAVASQVDEFISASLAWATVPRYQTPRQKEIRQALINQVLASLR